MTAAEWRPIPGCDGIYEASSEGRIRSLSRPRHPGRVLLGTRSDNGYLTVSIRVRGGKRTWSVHSLVALTFHGPRPEGLEVRHLNGDHEDNRPSNLAYGTPLQNADDTRRHGRHPNGRKTHCAHGHSFTDPQNVIHSRRGRRCRPCKNARHRQYKQRLRDARQDVAA